jgi:hypothetical protein
MCMSLHPADFENTKLYAGEARREDGTYVHVLAYQNRAASAGPNAMILPLPARGKLGPENAVDTRAFKRFLDDIHAATRIMTLSLSFSLSDEMDLEEGAQVFEVGSYTVVLAEEAAAVTRALDRIPAARRPALNGAILDAFARLYPGWPLAVCCWDGRVEAEPLLWWYEPRQPEQLFAPALDAHDGGPPNLDALVRVDHHVAFGSALDPERSGPPDGAEYDGHVSYADRIPGEILRLLPTRVAGTALQSGLPNGDFWCSTKRLRGPARRAAPGRDARAIEVPLDGWS